MQLTDITINAIWQNKNKQMVFSTEDLVLIKVVLSRKRLWQLMNNHTASLEITVNVHESVLSGKLVFWTSNWKLVIKYDIYVKFPWIFAHSVQICTKFSCTNFNDVCQVFLILDHYTWGAFFRGHAVFCTLGDNDIISSIYAICASCFPAIIWEMFVTVTSVS